MKGACSLGLHHMGWGEEQWDQWPWTCFCAVLRGVPGHLTCHFRIWIWIRHWSFFGGKGFSYLPTSADPSSVSVNEDALFWHIFINKRLWIYLYFHFLSKISYHVRLFQVSVQARSNLFKSLLKTHFCDTSMKKAVLFLLAMVRWDGLYTSPESVCTDHDLFSLQLACLIQNLSKVCKGNSCV